MPQLEFCEGERRLPPGQLSSPIPGSKEQQAQARRQSCFHQDKSPPEEAAGFMAADMPLLCVTQVVSHSSGSGHLEEEGVQRQLQEEQGQEAGTISPLQAPSTPGAHSALDKP